MIKQKGKRETFKRMYNHKGLLVLRAFLKSSMKYEVGSQLKLYEELKDLEKAVCNLPEDIKKGMEKFFGLIPNTHILAMVKVVKNGKDVIIEQELEDLANKGIQMLLDIEYMSKHDRLVKKSFSRIIQKAKKEGYVLSVTEVWKYVLLFMLFFETIENGNERWNLFLEKELNIIFLMKILQMFDVDDVAVMKSTVGLPLEEVEEGKAVSGLTSMEEVTEYRQKLFSYGDWNLTKSIFYGKIFDKEKVFSLFEECTEKVEGIAINDPYEIVALYSARKVW